MIYSLKRYENVILTCVKVIHRCKFYNTGWVVRLEINHLYIWIRGTFFVWKVRQYEHFNKRQYFDSS